MVLGLRRPELPAEEVLDGVHVRRLAVQRHQGAGLGTYLREYLSFLVRSGWAAVKLHRRHRFGLVQIHSLPDFLVFAALPLRLVGVPVLLDLHEAMPEFFVTRFPRSANPLSHRLLLLQERLSIAFATHVLTVNEAFGDRLLGLGLSPDKLSIVINSPSLERFDEAAQPRRAFREDGALRLIYTGALTPTYELDVTIRAVARHCDAAARPRRPLRPVRPRRFRGRAAGAGRRARHRRAGDVPRANPDRGRAGGGRRRGPRAGADPARPVYRDDPFDKGVRVRGDGQAGGRLTAAAGRAHVSRGHRRRLRAGRCRGDGRGDPRSCRRSAPAGSRRSRACGTWSAMLPGSARRSATWRSSSGSPAPSARAVLPRPPRIRAAPVSRPCAAPSSPRGRGRPPPARPRRRCCPARAAAPGCSTPSPSSCRG